MSQWARNNPEAERRAAWRADMAMEQWRMAQEGYEDEPDIEVEPLVLAAHEVLMELSTDVKQSLREV